MTNGDWNNAHRAWLGMLLTAPGAEALLLLLHAGGQDIPFRLPGPAGQTSRARARRQSWNSVRWRNGKGR